MSLITITNSFIALNRSVSAKDFLAKGKFTINSDMSVTAVYTLTIKPEAINSNCEATKLFISAEINSILAENVFQATTPPQSMLTIELMKKAILKNIHESITTSHQFKTECIEAVNKATKQIVEVTQGIQADLADNFKTMDAIDETMKGISINFHRMTKVINGITGNNAMNF